MVRRARFIPIALLAGAIWMGVSETPWWYLSIPLIVVGWFCATPNLNMADGCLAYLCIVGGFVLLGFHRPSGFAIVAGVMAGFYLSAVEMRVTAKPYIPEPCHIHRKDQTNKPRRDNHYQPFSLDDSPQLQP